MNKLTKEEVLHVANLARLDLSEEEIEKFSYQLKEILDSINKINDVQISTDELFIAPWTNNTTLREDNYKEYFNAYLCPNCDYAEIKRNMYKEMY